MLKDLSIADYLSKTASGDPVPGGGSAAALNAALAAALIEMVARLTIGRKNFEHVDAEMREAADNASALRQELIEDIDRDSDAYAGVLRAFQMPKGTEAEKAGRARAVQEAFKQAALVPLGVARAAVALMDLGRTVITRGNPNASLRRGRRGAGRPHGRARGSLQRPDQPRLNQGQGVHLRTATGSRPARSRGRGEGERGAVFGKAITRSPCGSGSHNERDCGTDAAFSRTTVERHRHRVDLCPCHPGSGARLWDHAHPARRPRSGLHHRRLRGAPVFHPHRQPLVGRPGKHGRLCPGGGGDRTFRLLPPAEIPALRAPDCEHRDPAVGRGALPADRRTPDSDLSGRFAVSGASRWPASR